MTRDRRSHKRIEHAVAETLEGRRLLDAYFVDGVDGDGLSAGGSDQALGTSIDVPFKTLQRAMDVVGPGDTIYIRGGIYREHVVARTSGTAEAPIIITAYNDEAPDIRGSEIVTGWVQHSTNVWKKTGWAYNSQQVFCNGANMDQIGRPPTGLYDTWQFPTPEGSGVGDLRENSFYYDTVADVLYVQLPGNADPNAGYTMEVSTGTTGSYGNHGRVFFAERFHQYLQLQGLTFQHSNTSASMSQASMVTVGGNSIVEDCTFQWADFGGLSVAYNDTAPAPENVQIINNRFLNNGDIGLTIPATRNFYIAGNTFTANNYRNFQPLWHAGGVKVASDQGHQRYPHGVIENNDAGYNNGPGIWFDYSNGPETSYIRGNYVHHNGKEGGIFYEASTHGRIYNNLLFENNVRGIAVSGSTDVDVYQNTIIGQKGIAAIALVASHDINPGDIQVYNNVIAGGTSYGDIDLGADWATNSSDYNNVYRPTGAVFVRNGERFSHMRWQFVVKDDTHSRVTDPVFAVGAGTDYRLSATSPGVNTGATLSEITTDYDGSARPVGGAYDMGAFEYQGAVGLEAGLVARYTLNDNVNDVSGNGNDGHLHYGPYFTTSAAEGSHALGFDGVNDRADLGNSAGFNMTGALSIGGWFSHASTGGIGNNSGAIDKGSYRLTVDPNVTESKWRFGVQDPMGGWHTITTADFVSNDQWHYVMGVFDGAQLRIYVDGVEAQTPLAYVGDVKIASTEMVLGLRQGTSYYYAGLMDDVRVYDRALSAGEVSELSAALTLDTGMVARYQLDSINAGTPKTTEDSSGNGHTATVSNYVNMAGDYVSGSGAFDFDGTDQVSVAGDGDFDLLQSLTISGWFNHDSVGGSSSGTAGAGKSTAYGIKVAQNNVAASQWQFYFMDSEGQLHTLTSPEAYANDQWHHVVGTYDGYTARLFVDGAQVREEAFVGSLRSSPTEAFMIGRRAGYYFPGMIDDVSLWERALSPDEVSVLFAS